MVTVPQHQVKKPKYIKSNSTNTGRQLPPLSSVLYRIISERRSVLAAKILLRENQVPRELALIAISLACLVVQ
jgi:hypothetical protein